MIGSKGNEGMKVYVIESWSVDIDGDWNSRQLKGLIFSTREKAQAYIDKDSGRREVVEVEVQ